MRIPEFLARILFFSEFDPRVTSPDGSGSIRESKFLKNEKPFAVEEPTPQLPVQPERASTQKPVQVVFQPWNYDKHDPNSLAEIVPSTVSASQARRAIDSLTEGE